MSNNTSPLWIWALVFDAGVVVFSRVGRRVSAEIEWRWTDMLRGPRGSSVAPGAARLLLGEPGPPRGSSVVPGGARPFCMTAPLWVPGGISPCRCGCGHAPRPRPFPLFVPFCSFLSFLIATARPFSLANAAIELPIPPACYLSICYLRLRYSIFAN